MLYDGRLRVELVNLMDDNLPDSLFIKTYTKDKFVASYLNKSDEECFWDNEVFNGMVGKATPLSAVATWYNEDTPLIELLALIK